MKLAMAQIPMRNNMNENYRKTLQYIEKAAGSDLLFFPQLQFSPYFPQIRGLNASVALSRESDARLKGIAYQAQKYHMCISPNVFLDDHGRQYDASFWFDSTGACCGTAGMVHLMNRPHAYEAEYFRPANTGFLVMDEGSCRVGIVIGTDRLFPESVRCCALRGAQLVIIPAAETDDQDLEMMVWEMRAQAKENQVYIAMCNRIGKEGHLCFAGHSMAAGPDGSLLFEADDSEQLIRLDIDPAGADAEKKKADFLACRNPVFYGVMSQKNDPDAKEEGEHA